MANLLFNGYQTGCGNLISGNTIVNYYYGYASSQASYYADLQPNTTYTIKRYDTSTRFRVALYDYDAKNYMTGPTEGPAPVQGWVADNSDPITFTTGAHDIYLVAYYTNASEYSTRVMLNEGSTIEEYAAPTQPFPYYWRVVDGKLTHLDMPGLIDPRYEEPYPYGVWYIQNGKLTHNGLPSLLEPEVHNGAFSGVATLTSVKIPKTVQSIGGYSFADTGLTSVKISRQCQYSSSSFPSGCEIEYYESE